MRSGLTLAFLAVLFMAGTAPGPVRAQAADVERAWAAARASSPTPVALDRERAAWARDRAEAGPDGDRWWIARWTARATRDAHGRALRTDAAGLARGCLDFGLMACSAARGGWLTAPGGARLYWQVQDGATEEDGITGGVVLLAEGADGRLAPVAWAFHGAHYEPPVLIEHETGLYVAAAGVIAGTGAFNADVLFRWTPGAVAPLVQIDNESWRDGLDARLPDGLEAWKGVAFDYESLTAVTALWQDDDANCCPTGGEAVLTFALEGDRLVLSGIEVSDPLIEAAMTTPTPVFDWIGRVQLCAHWAGEDAYDAARAADIAAAVGRLRCDALEADGAALRAAHAASPRLLALMRRAWGNRS